MNALLVLSLRSLLNRWGTALLTVIAIAISTTLLLSVQNLRNAARDGFANTISNADLIVGARSGPINLLLYSIFRLGDATANVSWASYLKIAHHPDVDWTIPISLGDSHRGFRVVGTTSSYFEHYQYDEDRHLAFAHGAPFSDLYDAVLGADVAKDLKYRVGDSIILSHGIGNISFASHKDKPFRVCGILQPTGTPVDRSVHVSLEAITAIHIDWGSGMQALPANRVSAAEARKRDLTPDSMTAFIIAMKSKVNVFTMQRAINDYREEPLLAIIPGVTLQQLWSLLGVADKALALIAAFVVLAGLIGMLTSILTGLNERRREMALLRSVGARPVHVFSLLMFEAGALSLAGVLLGLLLTYALLWTAAPWLNSHYGVVLRPKEPSVDDLLLLGGIVLAALLLGAVPAWRAFRNSLVDGLSMRF